MAGALGASGERPGKRPLGNHLQGALELLGEVGAQARDLPFIHVASGCEVEFCAGMEPDVHELPARPAACESGPNRSPIFRLHRARADLSGALLQLRDPCLGGIGVRSVVEAEDQLMGDAGALLGGQRQGGGKEVGGFGSHRSEV